MRNLTPLLFCLLPIVVFAQNKVYYNKLNEKVDSTQDYEHYEIVEKQADGLTLERRFSKKDTLVFQGKYSRYQVKGQNDIREGAHQFYYRNGVLHYVYNYLGNELHGENLSYYTSGQLKRKEVYEQGKFIRGECFNEDGTERAFTRFEQLPSFPGGQAELYKYLSSNLEYPSLARENGIQGQVLLSFLVNKDGSISDVQLLRDIGGGCGQEAVRLVYAMPNWIPGSFDDAPIKVRYTLPLSYKLEGKVKRKRKKN